MQRFISFTLQQKVFMNLLFVLLIVIGAFTLLRMPMERYPNIQFGKMYIVTFLPGGSPEEVETLITKEIEKSLEDVEELEFISSSSFRERSNIVIKFNDGSDYRKKFNDVRLKVLSILDELPEDAEPPIFNFLDVNDWFPAIAVNIAGNHTNKTLSLVAEEIKLSLNQIDGVNEVRISGEYQREFHIMLSMEKLQKRKVTLAEVIESIRETGVSFPAGNTSSADGEFILRVDEQFTAGSELLSTIIRRDQDGSFVTLDDLLDSKQFSHRDPVVMTSVNGNDCVTLQVMKHPDGNALFIAQDVIELVDRLKPAYEESGINLTVTRDSSLKIKDAARVLGVNLLIGVFLVCSIIWFFMGFRNAVLTTIGIPFAFLVTMILMYLTGNSVNEVSLFAFVLVSGIIVDDAIVVVENIHRHYEQGKKVDQAIIEGTAEVFLPVISATLTTVMAFLPMLIMTGMVGDFFAIIPKTIGFALIASILECLFILPCHVLEFGPGIQDVTTHGKNATGIKTDTFRYSQPSDGRIMRSLRQLLHALILVTLKFRFLTLTLLGLLFIGSLAIFGTSFLGKSNLMRIQFFPDDYSLYYMELTGPPGTPLILVHDHIKNLSKKIMEQGEKQAESALGFAGFYIADDFSPKYGTNLGYAAVTLPTTDIREFQDYPVNDVVKHLDDVRNYLAPFVPEGYALSIRPEKDGPPTGKDLNIRILGKNSENVELLSERIFSFLSNQKDIKPWLQDLSDDQGAEAKVMHIRIDKEKAVENGLTVAEVAGLAASVVEGTLVGEMKLPDETIDIRLKTINSMDESIFGILDLTILEKPGGVLKLRDICNIEYNLEPGYLNRFDSQRAITLTANIKKGAPVTSPMVVNSVKGFYSSIRSQYPGATLNFAGEHESTQKSFISLAYAFIIAVIVIYLILAAQFKSYLQPMIIISAIVFALIGVVFGTVVSRTLFTVNSFIAVIGVAGVVVNDSLVLVDFINKTYQKGTERSEALLQATHIRLRPILLTTLTTTLGLFPMALGIPEYSIIWGSMAMTFVTGLCTATFLTIIIVPVLWDVMSEKRPPN